MFSGTGSMSGGSNQVGGLISVSGLAMGVSSHYCCAIR